MSHCPDLPSPFSYHLVAPVLPYSSSATFSFTRFHLNVQVLRHCSVLTSSSRLYNAAHSLPHRLDSSQIRPSNRFNFVSQLLRHRQGPFSVAKFCHIVQVDCLDLITSFFTSSECSLTIQKLRLDSTLLLRLCLITLISPLCSPHCPGSALSSGRYLLVQTIPHRPRSKFNFFHNIPVLLQCLSSNISSWFYYFTKGPPCHLGFTSSSRLP